MSRRDWLAGIAVGLATTVACLAQEVDPEGYVAPQPAQQQASDESAVESSPADSAIAPTEPAETKHDDRASSDSERGTDHWLFWGGGLAQWVMAMIGAPALFLSAWAVWLLRQTLKATRDAVKAADDAVKVTRDLGEAQIRAYLHCKSAKYKLTKDTMIATVEIENTGQSPASHVSIKGMASVHDVGGFLNLPRVIDWVNSEIREVSCEPITSRSTITEQVIFWWSLDFIVSESDNPRTKKMVFETGNEISFDLILKWSDVFSTKHEIPVVLHAIVAASPYNPHKKGRSRTGRLELRMEDARHRVSEPDDAKDRADQSA